jgi:hypothetical protein
MPQNQRPLEPPPLEKPMGIEEGWQQKKLPEMQEWDKPGTQISGKLISCQQIVINPEGQGEKKVWQYVIQATNSLQLKFLGTYDIVQKLYASDVGKLVKIKYLGEDKTIKKGSNFMKVFDIHVRQDPTQGPPVRDSGPITDEDIPF